MYSDPQALQALTCGGNGQRLVGLACTWWPIHTHVLLRFAWQQAKLDGQVEGHKAGCSALGSTLQAMLARSGGAVDLMWHGGLGLGPLIVLSGCEPSELQNARACTCTTYRVKPCSRGVPGVCRPE
jgi:hypothetical protein